VRRFPKEYKLINREIGWLAFNGRVLQEAEDPSVPLLERIKFLGIFSSNLDEFFRVRVASLRRRAKLRIPAVFPDEKPEKILNQIQDIVLNQQARFEDIFRSLTDELETENVHLINETRLTVEQSHFVRDYFSRVVRPVLVPIMLDQVVELPELKGHAIYQAVTMSKKNRKKMEYALIEIPTETVPRFVVLPSNPGGHFVMLVEDVIRFCLNDIFAIFDYDTFTSYTIKITRDAELDLDNDISESYIDKIQRSISQRRHGQPVRFIYEEKISKDLLHFLIKKLGIRRAEESLIPVRRRYHNFKDFIEFPKIGASHLVYPEFQSIEHPRLINQTSLIQVIASEDVLLHYPYHTFRHFIDLLREAAIDPKVISIKMTLYRAARQSNIINALVNAIRNGKQVTVVIELQARFDEEANINWSKILAEAGAKIIVGVPQLKVHAKLCLITRKESGKLRLYGNISTGNYNETTARFYTDHSLLTADRRITSEISKLFDFFENNTRLGSYSHLIVSPFALRKKILLLIHQEIRNARRGIPAKITIKLNGLTDPKIIAKLYDASREGVVINLIVRGTCAVVSGKKGFSDGIKAISIIDRFLEHSRIYSFHNAGDEKIYISSSDWMPRSFDHRIEVACPIYDQRLQSELKHYIATQLSDTAKARVLNGSLENPYPDPSIAIRSQTQLIQWFRT